MGFQALKNSYSYQCYGNVVINYSYRVDLILGNIMIRFRHQKNSLKKTFSVIKLNLVDVNSQS